MQLLLTLLVMIFRPLLRLLLSLVLLLLFSSEFYFVFTAESAKQGVGAILKRKFGRSDCRIRKLRLACFHINHSVTPMNLYLCVWHACY